MDENKDIDNEEIIINEEDDNAVGGKIKKLKEKLEYCQKEKQDYLTGWQRAQADFINYKRRQEEQVGEWLKMANVGLIGDLLPILDTLEASTKNSADNGGLMALYNQLLKILSQYGLEEIKSIGEKFNPEFHEAIEQVESENGEEGKIAEVAQKGYLLNGKVIRVAKVKVIK